MLSSADISDPNRDKRSMIEPANTTTTTIIWQKKYASWRILLSVWAFHLLLSGAFMAAFRYHFIYVKRIIPIHLAFVLLGLLLCTLVLGGLLRVRAIRASRWSRCVVTLLPASAFALLLYLYAANIISQSLWNGSFTYTLAREYLPQLKALGAQHNMLPWFYALVGGILVVSFGGYWLVSRPLQRSLETLFLPQSGENRFASRRRVAAFLLLALFSAIAGGWVIKRELKKHRRFVVTEPVLGFFYGNTLFFQVNAHRLAVLQKDLAARAAYPRQQNFQKRNVVLIITDSLRADSLPIYGYPRPTTPFLTQLAEKGQLQKVELALSLCPVTFCGVPAIMSSKTPPNITPNNFTLPNLLHDMGYDLHFILSTNHNWYGLRQYYGHEMKMYFDGGSVSDDMPKDDRAVVVGLERLPVFQGTPAYFQFHLTSPHAAVTALPEYRRYAPASVPNVTFPAQITPAEVTAVRDAYDDRVLQTDDFIAKIFRALEQKGYLANSIVVIVSDHGEGLGEHGHFVHGNFLHQEDLRIPFLIYEATPAHYRNLQFATQAEVAPTIAERLGLIRPTVWEGNSLLSGEPLPPYTYHQCRFSQHRYSHAVIYRTDTTLYKYIKTVNRALTEELYELKSDPQEQRNLITTAEPSLLQDLRAHEAQHQWR